jgi:CBS domain containing-hemolysin-like protein
MDDLNELHDIQLPLDPCYTTVGGFLLERLGHAPRVGEFVDFSGYRFAVAEIDRQTISRIRIQDLTGRAHMDRTAELTVRSEDAGPDSKPSRN